MRERELTCYPHESRKSLFYIVAAEDIVSVLERFENPHQVNLGSGSEISIKDLVSLITSLTGFQEQVVWDTTQHNEQPSSRPDTARAKGDFGFRVGVPLEEGLQKAVDLYK